MHQTYTKTLKAAFFMMVLSGMACGQNNHVKTITIINGDTTIKEENLDEKALAEIEKQLDMTINDGDSSHKIHKKIIITQNDKNPSHSESYSYTITDDDNEKGTSDEKNETKISIITDDKTGSNPSPGTRIIRKNTIIKDDSADADQLNISIQVKNTNANVSIETSGQTPIYISILDENGKQVFYDSQTKGGTYQKEIPLKKKGTYFLNLIQNKKSTTEKIIVE
jgi:hypothetical protein